MNSSRPFHELPCLTQATLIHVCLTDADLLALRHWGEAKSPCGLSPRVWCRAFLHRRAQIDAAVERRLSDTLDLQFLDTVVLVRSMPLHELDEVVEPWVDEPGGAALPGLLWALCTDGRSEVQALGQRLVHECTALAFQQLVGGSPVVER